MDLELRAVNDDETIAYHRATATAFGSIPSDEDLGTWGRERFEPDRSLAVFDDGEIVATAGAFTFTLTVPGGAQVGAAGVTAVGVRPTHRRRGLLRHMMDAQLDDVSRRGEPLAVLTASEGPIYGRFGYGLATFNSRWTMPTEGLVFAVPSSAGGRMRLLRDGDGASIAGSVFDSAAACRVGEVTRSMAYWERVFEPRNGPVSRSGDRKPFFTVVHERDDGTADALARYTVKEEYSFGRPAGVLDVLELHAIDTAVEAALWEYLASVDLVTLMRTGDRPIDDPLRWRLADPRRLQVTEVTDHLWIRVLDVAAALSARTYATDDALVLELDDAFRPANSGCWRVEGSRDLGVCLRTDAPPDLALSAADLGALYLGGTGATTLAQAGRARELTTGAIARADRLFSTHPLPWCSTHF